MDFTSDKLRSLVRKWQSLIEAHIDVKTTDGYLVRLFAIAFTKRRNNQVSKTTYAQTAQIREIRKKMFEIMTREATSCDLKELVQKFVPEAIGREIEKAARGIFPIQNVYIRKAKIVKAPKFDINKLLELHGEVTDVRPFCLSYVCKCAYPLPPGHWYKDCKGLQGARSSRGGLNTVIYLLGVLASCTCIHVTYDYYAIIKPYA
jgi:hypothetical protein